MGAERAAGAAGSRLVGNQRIAPKKPSQLRQANPGPQKGWRREEEEDFVLQATERGTTKENLGWICCMGKDLTYALCCPV